MLLFFHNDLLNLSDEINNPILKLYLDDKNFSQNLKKKQKIIDELVLKQINQEDENSQSLKFKRINFSFLSL